jgi:preprotein translocase subunit YajC
MEPLIFIAILVALLWLLVLRPQRRRASDHTSMIGNLSENDEIVTAGGLYGRILRIDDDVLTVEIAPETTVRIARGAIAGVITEKEEDEEEVNQGAPATPIEPDDR